MQFAQGGPIEPCGVDSNVVPIPIEPDSPPYLLPAAARNRHRALLEQLNAHPPCAACGR